VSRQQPLDELGWNASERAREEQLDLVTNGRDPRCCERHHDDASVRDRPRPRDAIRGIGAIRDSTPGPACGGEFTNLENRTVLDTAPSRPVFMGVFVMSAPDLRRVLGLAVAITALPACYQGLDGDRSDAGSGNASGGDDDDGEPQDRFPDTQALCEDADPSTAAVRMRLLTRYEYDNTVRDLLGDTTAPARAFAHENKSGLFENDAAVHQVSKDVVRQYLDAAEDIATRAVTERMPLLVSCDPLVSGEAVCGQQLVASLLPRAFRRPADAAETAAFAALFDAALAQYGYVEAVSLTTQAILQSPQFLYRIENVPAGAAPGDLVAVGEYEMASRLSYFLTGSMPDADLLAAAAAGTLADPEALELQARRLLESPAGRASVADFHRQWLGLDGLGSVAKDPLAFPDLDATTFAADWNDSVQQFIAHVFFTENATMAELFGAPQVFLTPELAAFYQASGQDPVTGSWTIPGKRAGLLTQPGLLGMLAYPDGSSPVARGVFVRKRLLCQELAPPPDVPLDPPSPDPNATTRERFAEHTSNPACAGCHALIDPLGFPFENYDGAGRWRTTENGQPIDASGEIIGIDDPSALGPVADAAELSARLATSTDAQACVVENWAIYALGRRLDDDLDACSVESLQATLADSDGDLLELMVAITLSDAFRYRMIGGGDA